MRRMLGSFFFFFHIEISKTIKRFDSDGAALREKIEKKKALAAKKAKEEAEKKAKEERMAKLKAGKLFL